MANIKSTRIKLSTNFYADEFVSPAIYNNKQINPIWYIRKNLVESAQLLRDILGQSVVVNNWHNGGVYQYSGYREPACKEGATLSQHRAFNALDLKSGNMSGTQLLEAVESNWEKFNRLGITTAENPQSTPTWLHLDCRFLNIAIQKKIFIVNP